MDEGLRAYMLGVYNYMAAGVALTGVTAYLTSMMAVARRRADAVRRGALHVAAEVGGHARPARLRALPRRFRVAADERRRGADRLLGCSPP